MVGCSVPGVFVLGVALLAPPRRFGKPFILKKQLFSISEFQTSRMSFQLTAVKQAQWCLLCEILLKDQPPGREYEHWLDQSRTENVF